MPRSHQPNSRYSVIRTLAVFSVDNDMLVDMNYMDFAFESWRAVNTHSIVGFAIRVAKKSIEKQWMGLYEAHCEEFIRPLLRLPDNSPIIMTSR